MFEIHNFKNSSSNTLLSTSLNRVNYKLSNYVHHGGELSRWCSGLSIVIIYRQGRPLAIFSFADSCI